MVWGKGFCRDITRTFTYMSSYIRRRVLYCIAVLSISTQGFCQDSELAQHIQGDSEEVSRGSYNFTSSASYQRSSSPAADVQAQNSVIGTATLGATYTLIPHWDVSGSLMWMYGKVVGMGAYVASMPNGLFSYSSATPFLGTAFIHATLPLGSEESSQLELFAGQIAPCSILEQNAYANDPTSQFMNLVVLNSGAYEVCAEARGGSSYGAAAQYRTGETVFTALAAALPTEAGGNDLNTDFAHAHAFNFQCAGNVAAGHRVRGLLFINVSHARVFDEALKSVELPDLTTKVGLSIDADHEIDERWGLFERISWNDGKSESMALTEINASLCVGTRLAGGLLNREGDESGAAVVYNALSHSHRVFLEQGGSGFVLDKVIHYTSEIAAEVYYRFTISSQLSLTLDAQCIFNPGFERERIPLRLLSSRWTYSL